MDDFDLDFVAAGAQERGNVVGLPQGELGAAGADTEGGRAARGIGHIVRVRGLGGVGIGMKGKLPEAVRSAAAEIAAAWFRTTGQIAEPSTSNASLRPARFC